MLFDVIVDIKIRVRHLLPFSDGHPAGVYRNKQIFLASYKMIFTGMEIASNMNGI